MRTRERRSYAASLRAETRGKAAAGAATIVGYAAVYNSFSELLDNNGGGFYERIAPGTFARALDRNPDVRFLVDHKTELLLGRTKSGTLRLADDARGLRIEADPPDTQ